MPDDLLSPDEISALLSGGDVSDGNVDDLSEEDSARLDDVAKIFADSEQSVIGMLAGKNVNVSVGNSEIMNQEEFASRFVEPPFLFSSTFGGFEDRLVALVVEQHGALTLANMMMGGGAEIPEPNDLFWGAAQEGLNQIISAAFTGLSNKMKGKRLSPENSGAALGEDDWRVFSVEPVETKLWLSPVNIAIEGFKPFDIWTVLPLDTARDLSYLIRDILEGKDDKTAASSSSPASSGSSGGGFGTGSSPASSGAKPASFPSFVGGGGGNSSPTPIDIIADIPVRVTVELGKSRKSVSEILALSSGAVIELDKVAGEPVDILVNGKVIAHGEVVVIEENFGVRITDLNGAA